MSFQRTLSGLAAAVAILALPLAVNSAAAQNGTPTPVAEKLAGATVTRYAGTCDGPLTESLGEVGTLEHQTVVSDSPSSPVAGEAQTSRTIRLLGEDLNGNGVLDPGEDRNNNGVLDPGLLENEDVVPDAALMITNVPEVWMLEGPIEFDPVPPSDQEQALVVRQGSGDEARFVACGGLLRDVHEEDPTSDLPVFTDLAPVDDAGYRGFARFPQTDDGAQAIQVVMFEVPPGEATPTP